MHFSPYSSFAGTVLAYFPFALTEDPEPGTFDNNADWSFRLSQSNDHVQLLGSLGQQSETRNLNLRSPASANNARPSPSVWR